MFLLWKVICIASLVFFVITVVVAGFTFHKDQINYYNKFVPKRNVDVNADFHGNLLFDRYDVTLKIYDQIVNLPHGINKHFNLELPDGNHKLEFSGNGKYKTVNLKIKGNTKVVYKIFTTGDEIKVSEIEIKHLKDEK